MYLSINRDPTLHLADRHIHNQPMSTRALSPRFAEQRLTEALADSPAVLIHGPRQCGKTTLAQTVGRPKK